MKCGSMIPFCLLLMAPLVSQEEADDHLHEEGIVQLETAQLHGLNITTVAVGKGSLTDRLSFPAEIQFDPRRVAHLTPRVAGIVKEVYFQLGDNVPKGSVLAILESRELGMLKSDYLAALARQALREKVFLREKRLWERSITAEQEYLEAEQALEESRIELRRARETLFSLGISESTLGALTAEDGSALNRYRMTMPFTGRIIEQHITQGEVLKEDNAAFVVADASRVWAMARVPESDLNLMQTGQEGIVTLSALSGRSFPALVDFIGNRLDSETRTAQARVVLENPDLELRAGMFAKLTVMVPGKAGRDTFILPSSAVQRRGAGEVVFRELGNGRYQMVQVQILARADGFVEVIGPLQSGEAIATGDTFVLKSLAGKEEMGGSHAH